MPIGRADDPGISLEPKGNSELAAMVDFSKLLSASVARRATIATHILIAGALALAGSPPAVAQTPAPSSRTIDIIVGMPPGGGVDAYARLVQRHLPAHLAGEPVMVVQNMPGAGSLRSVMAVSHQGLLRTQGHRPARHRRNQQERPCRHLRGNRARHLRQYRRGSPTQPVRDEDQAGQRV
jgi:hypothetical protein